MNNEPLEKLRNEQKTQGGMVGMAVENADSCENSEFSTPKNQTWRLRMQADQLHAQARTAQKVARIIEKHPEFLEFMEVLRSGLV